MVDSLHLVSLTLDVSSMTESPDLIEVTSTQTLTQTFGIPVMTSSHFVSTSVTKCEPAATPYSLRNFCCSTSSMAVRTIEVVWRPSALIEVAERQVTANKAAVLTVYLTMIPRWCLYLMNRWVRLFVAGGEGLLIIFYEEL